MIDRFRHTVSDPLSLISSTTTPSTVKASSSSTLTVTTTSTPLEEDDEFDDLYGDTRYSQLAPTQSEPAHIDRRPLSLTSVNPSTSSSQSSTNPLSPLANRSTSTTLESKRIDIAFKDANQSRIKFCFDMAHRSILSLKANSITARLHGDNALGIEAPSVSETMVRLLLSLWTSQHESSELTSDMIRRQLDVLQVSKRASGIASARLKVRPLTLLTSQSSTDDPIGGSPSKRQRLV